MKGVTPDGRIIDLAQHQEIILRIFRTWATSSSQVREVPVYLPYMGRQSGRSVVLATVAEYDRQGWPEDLLSCEVCRAPGVIENGWWHCPANRTHHMHNDGGTVEGCGGCFCEPVQSSVDKWTDLPGAPSEAG